MKSKMGKLFAKKKLKCLSMAVAGGMFFALTGSSTAFAEELYPNLYGAEKENDDHDISPYDVTRNSKGVTSAKDKATNTCAKFTVEGGTWENIYGGYSGINGADTTRNYVEISGGEISGNIFGGYSVSNHARTNQVFITGGTIGSLDKKVNIYGGYSVSKAASGNSVTISLRDFTSLDAPESIIYGDVFGGYGEQQDAKDNTVTIINGTINGDVIAGAGKIASFNNVINLGNADGADGKAIITGDLYLNVRDRGGGRYEHYSQGTLNVYNCGHKVTNLCTSGDVLKFYLKKEDLKNTDERLNIMLTVTGKADITNSTIKAGAPNLGDVDPGKQIILLSAETLNADNIKTGIISDGILEADLRIDKVENQIIAVANSTPKKAATESKLPAETQAASMSLVNLGGDMFGGSIITSATQALNMIKLNGAGNEGISLSLKTLEPGSISLETPEPESKSKKKESDSSSVKSNKSFQEALSNMVPFATVGAGSNCINSGSHVDMKSWNIAVGFAKEVANNSGKFMFGPVIEYGRGDYDSYLDNGSHADGNSSFYGIGFVGKQTYNNDFYLEGSVRFGHAKNEFNYIHEGVDQGYENGANYFGAHIGVGKVVPLNEKDNIDYYGKLFYSHQNGSSATLHSGHVYDFAAVDSFRTRLGFRYNHTLNDISTFYAGLAWQHEFASECNATIHSGSWTVEAPAPSVKGDTGILELGWNIKADQGRFETGLGFTGSIGKQRGIGGNILFKWNF